MAIYTEKAVGYITRLKYTHLVNEVKNINLLKKLEEHRADSKTIKVLNVNENEITNQEQILNETF